jgi:1-acyl-sn-glycerol-3-phosphate acyltransferase
MSFRVYTVFLIGIGIMIIFSVLLPFIFIFRALHMNKLADRMVAGITTFWARVTLLLNGVQYKAYGLENIPEHNNFCIISNHQSNFDIPLILGNVPKVIGFISKIELSRIPMLNLWMYVIRCPFIDRRDKQKSLAVIEQRIQKTLKGQPMLIFPEGTRSKMQDMNAFKKGGISSIIEADAMILPLTVCNTHKFFEGANGDKTRPVAKLIVHKPFKPSESGLSKEELIVELERIIHPFNQKRTCVE